MMRVLSLINVALFLCCAVIACESSASGAQMLKITVTNDQPAGGFSLTPVWLGFHDGSFQTFDPGSAANPNIQAIAELGDSSLMTAAFQGHGVQTTLSNGGPYLPGTSATTILNIDDPMTERF